MKNKVILLFSILSSFLLVALLTIAMLSPAQAAGTIYVDVDSSCNSGCGGSWANAHPNLQDALAAAQPDDEIWVAEGVYYPDDGSGQVADGRGSTFALQSGVAIYGGFTGSENSPDERANPLPPTVLSGDIDENDTTDASGVVTDTAVLIGNNAYHVVTGSGVDATAVLDGVIITAGQANDPVPNHEGGGMYTDNGSPTLNDVTFRGNLANGNGAGMVNKNESSPLLTAVVFANNRTLNGWGGGLANLENSHPSLTSVLFERNQASGFAGGMGNSGSHPTLTDVVFRENSSNGSGGAMSNAASSPTLTAVTFISNTANINGGGMNNSSGSNPTLTDVIFSGNEGNFGGGMANSGSAPILTAVTFMSNTAATYGSGMFNSYSDAHLVDVTFAQNHSTTQGGGMYNVNSNPMLTNTTFIENSASSYGGGMRNFSNSNPTLTNVTFSGNTADGQGGGMLNANSNPTLINVTFSDNGAKYGGGALSNYGAEPLLINVIIANSSDDEDCANDSGSSLAAGSGHILIESATYACGLTNGVDGNIVGQDPNLGPLADNGGQTLTHALLPGSPAIDAGDDANCPDDDQRGMARPQPTGGQCDMGAYERDTMPPTVDVITHLSPNPTDAASVQFLVTFSEDVKDVDMADFELTATGLLTGTAVTDLTGSGTTYTVSVSTGESGGTLQLDVPTSATINDLSDNAMVSLPYNSGEVYTVLGIQIYLPMVIR